MNTYKGYTLEAVECTKGWMVWYGKPDAPRMKMRTTRARVDAATATQEAIDIIDLITRK